MGSPPSKKKLPIQNATGEVPNTPVQQLPREQIFGVEEVHRLLLESCVFVSIAHEIDHDKRWPGRMTILLRAANAAVTQALESVELLLRNIYPDRKRKQKRAR